MLSDEERITKLLESPPDEHGSAHGSTAVPETPSTISQLGRQTANAEPQCSVTACSEQTTPACPTRPTAATHYTHRRGKIRGLSPIGIEVGPDFRSCHSDDAEPFLPENYTQGLL